MILDKIKTVRKGCVDGNPRTVYSLSEKNEGDIIKTVLGKCFVWDMQEFIAVEMLKMLNRRVAHEGHWTATWHTVSGQSLYDRSSGLFRTSKPIQMVLAYWDKGEGCGVTVDEDPMVWIELGLSDLVDQCEQAYQKYVSFAKEADEVVTKAYRDATGEKFLNIPTIANPTTVH